MIQAADGRMHDGSMVQTSPRRIFISGASSGLGEGLARHYARPQTALGLVARRTAKLQALRAELQELGATVRVYTQDVADTSGMARAAEDYLAAENGIDLVIANAAVGLSFGRHEQTAEQAVRLIDINVNGVINTLLPFIATMLRQRSGVLVGISSFAGFRAMPWRSAYCASKSAVKIYMDGIRMELRGTGVHAMAICPGFVDTPLITESPGQILVLKVPRAVRSITRAIDRRRKTCTFPWPLRLIRPVWGLIPEAVFTRLIPAPHDARRDGPDNPARNAEPGVQSAGRGI